jgi:tetratricopeptide (TPR) repeat protein/predicted Ser/Thr protein kinase
MQGMPQPNDNRQERVLAALSDYVRRVRAGSDMRWDDFLEEQPELANDLQALLAEREAGANSQTNVGESSGTFAAVAAKLIAAPDPDPGAATSAANCPTLPLSPGRSKPPHENDESQEPTVVVAPAEAPKGIKIASRPHAAAEPRHGDGAPLQGNEPTLVLGQALPVPSGMTTQGSAARSQHQPVIGRLGDYELLCELGRGGMGVVYKARQLGLNRLVAVKMVLAGRLASAEDVQRFRIEAEAAANLRHAGIVAIYEVGQHDGHHFYSMEYVEGTNLSSRVKEHSLPADEAARIVQAIAEAIDHAHRHGTLHRDLKPSNVLIDSSGQPKVTDFGLAKRIEADSQLTASGALLGTPSYMPPEQARGDLAAVSVRSDVYSLGALLYELLTGRPPFRGSTPVETLHQVLNAEPVAPRLLNPKTPRDLETICLKCLEKEPARRYASAAELAADVARLCAGEPILARPIGPVQRAWRWCKRKPALALLLAALAVSILLGFLGITWQYIEADAARGVAQRNFDNLRGATGQMFDVMDEWLERVPEEEDVQQELLRRGLTRYEQLLQADPKDPAARFELAATHRRVARLRRRLGDYTRAVEHYQQAIEGFRRLAAEFPNETSYRRNWADACNWLGEAHRERGAMPLAQAAYQDALQLQEPLANNTGSPEYVADLARTRYNLGLVYSATGRTSEAEASYREAIQLLQPLVDVAAPLPEHAQGLARCRINLGLLLESSKQPDAAAGEYRAAVQILEALTERFPRQRDYQYELATAHLNQGKLPYLRLVANRDDTAARDAAQADFQIAAELLKQLAYRYANVPQYRKELANALNNLGSVLHLSGRADEAQPQWEAARNELQALAARNPDVAEIRSRLGMTLGNLARAARDRQDLATARSLAEAAIAHQTKALELNSQNPEFRSFLHNHHYFLAGVLLAQQDHANAAEQAEQLPKLLPEGWREWHRAAAMLGQCAALAQRDERLDESQRANTADGYCRRSVELLNIAIRNGFNERRRLESDSRFDALRQRSDFQSLLAGLKEAAK